VKLLASKSISLTPRESKKSKKQDKYSESSKTKREYAHDLKDEVVYLGIVEEYKNTLATIIKRSRNHLSEYYSIKFSLDEEILDNIAGGVLISLENYEAELAMEKEKEEKNNTNSQEDDNQNDMSEEEKKIIDKGLEPYRNKSSCYNPVFFYERRCEQCSYELRCIYTNKHKYNKNKY